MIVLVAGSGLYLEGGVFLGVLCTRDSNAVTCGLEGYMFLVRKGWRMGKGARVGGGDS